MDYTETSTDLTAFYIDSLCKTPQLFGEKFKNRNIKLALPVKIKLKLLDFLAMAQNQCTSDV